VQTPEGPAPWPGMNGRRIARCDPPPPSLPPLTETIPIPGGQTTGWGDDEGKGKATVAASIDVASIRS
jgi:hypothetical protein